MSFNTCFTFSELQFIYTNKNIIMALSNLFRNKTVQDILIQVEKNESDRHNSLGKHLTAKALITF